MLKKTVFLFLLIVGVLIGILTYNYLRFSSPKYAEGFKHIDTQAQPEILAGALKFETISQKAGMIDHDTFDQLQAYVDSVFPLLDSLLTRYTLNQHAQIYHWKGLNKDAKPIIISAHTDVVPVEYATRKQWLAEPFEGAIKDGFIYGRGTLDDKGSYISILNAVHNLLEARFQPNCDVYLCFGHDEEVGGELGAKAMVAFLKAKNVKASFALDEGGILTQGLVPGLEQPVALIGTSEKGYVSLDLSVQMTGGHSSMPAKSSAVNSLLQALNKLDEHPLPPRFSEPLKGFAEHVGPELPFAQRLAFSNQWLFKNLIFSTYDKKPTSAALIRTTQAITIVRAGIKDNVIPARASATINFRLLPGDEPDKIMDRVRGLVDDSLISIKIHDDFSTPASPVSSAEAPPFVYLQRCISTIFPEALVSPYLVLGATDGRYYYEVADQVYRFMPILFKSDDVSRLHGVNERLSVDGYKDAVNFYATLFRNLNAL
jgi:carboxypeptidase PM20D1